MMSPLLRRTTSPEPELTKQRTRAKPHGMTNVRTQAHSRRQTGFSEVTNVIRKAGAFTWLTAVLACSVSAQALTPAHMSGSAESLYFKLRSVGLDKSRVYKIRGGALDRAS